MTIATLTLIFASPAKKKKTGFFLLSYQRTHFLFLSFVSPLHFTLHGNYASFVMTNPVVPPFHYVAKMVAIKGEMCPGFHTQYFDCYKYTHDALHAAIPVAVNTRLHSKYQV